MARRKTAATRSSAITADTRMAVIHGPDDFGRREVLEQLRGTLETAHGQVDLIFLDGRQATLSDVFDEARSLSLMQLHKLVVVDEAEAFVKTHRAALERYAQEPAEQATLVLRSEKWNSGKLDDLIAAVGFVRACKPPGPAEAVAHVQTQAQAQGAVMASDAAQQLVEQLGPDLMRLTQEVNKLSLMVENDAPITAELVREQSGCQSEEKVYVLREAILQSLVDASPAPALMCVRELIDRAGLHPDFVYSQVNEVMRQMALWFLMKRAKTPDDQIRSTLRLFGPMAGLMPKAVGRLDTRQLVDLLAMSLQLQQRSRRSLGDARRNLELFCVRMMQALK